jgi:repressor LexA
MIRLAPRQKVLLMFVRDYHAAHGYPPTVREMANALGVTSTNGVNQHLVALERKGYVRRTPGIARSTVVLRGPSGEWPA